MIRQHCSHHARAPVVGHRAKLRGSQSARVGGHVPTIAAIAHWAHWEVGWRAEPHIQHQWCVWKIAYFLMWKARNISREAIFKHGVNGEWVIWNYKGHQADLKCVGMYVCMYVCMYVRAYVRTYVWMDVCMYVCTCVRTYVRMDGWIDR